MARRKISDKNTDLLVAQQRDELAKLRNTIPVELIRAAEDKLLVSCLEIVESSLDFASLGFNADGEVDEKHLPFEWGLLTPEQKARKIRLAKYACLPTQQIPHGVKLAHATLIGIIKSRATEKAGTKIFNLEVSTFPAPAPLTPQKEALDADFEVLDLD
jgi:hypothetical protein